MSDFTNRPMRDALIGTIYEQMATRPDYFFLSADMGAPALDMLRSDYPDRFINTGIAEQNLINVAAGLAREGFVVFTYAIAPFYMRAYEQIRINLSLPAHLRPMNVNMLALGAGISYDVSGPTHHCLEDLSIMRALPYVSTLSPADSVTALAIADYIPVVAKPKYIRLDGKVFASQRKEDNRSLSVEAGYDTVCDGDGVCLVATGIMVHIAKDVARRFPGKVRVTDVFRLDDDIDTGGLVKEVTRNCPTIICLEEAFTNRGGLGAFVATLLNQANCNCHRIEMGMKSEFDFNPGSRATLHIRNNISADDIAAVVEKALT